MIRVFGTKQIGMKHNGNKDNKELNMKNGNKNFKNGFLSKTTWKIGICLGIMTSSFIVWSVVPNLFVSGNPIIAQDVNDNFTYLENKIEEQNYGVLLGIGSNQAFNTSAYNPLTVDVIIKDTTGGAFDTGTSRFTVPTGEAGFYTIKGSLVWQNLDTNGSNLRTRIVVNGTDNVVVTEGSSSVNTAGAFGSSAGNVGVYLSDGDYFEFEASEAYACSGTATVQAGQAFYLIKKDF